MALKKYIIDIDSRGSKAGFEVVYKAGKIHRIERKRGVLKIEQWLKLTRLIPQEQQVIEEMLQDRMPPGVEVKKEIKQASLYTQMNDAFFNFYAAENNDLEYSFSAKDGKALKMIISALKKQCADDAEVFATWQAILTNWSKLEKFYRDQMDLTQINSNLNKILRQLSNATSTGKSKAKNHADGIRESL